MSGPERESLNAKVFEDTKTAKEGDGVEIGMRHRDLPDEVERVGRSIIGAAIEVHRHLGPGLLETIYEEALSIELALRDLGVARQFPLVVTYKGNEITGQRLDLLVERAVVVELKSLERIHPVHKAQTLSYCRAGDFPLGLLINFNTAVLRDGIHRVFNPSAPSPACASASVSGPAVPAPDPVIPSSRSSRLRPPSR